MKTNIKVAVRVRPPMPHEIANKSYIKSLAVGENQKLFISMSGKPVILNKDETKSSKDVAIFGYDKTLDSGTTQNDIYDLVRPAVSDVVNKGINACIFAYG